MGGHGRQYVTGTRYKAYYVEYVNMIVVVTLFPPIIVLLFLIGTSLIYKHTSK